MAPEKTEALSSSQHASLLKALKEYSEKLRLISFAHLHQRGKDEMMLVYSLTSILIILMFSVIFFPKILNDIRVSESSQSIIPIITIFAVISGLLWLSLFTIRRRLSHVSARFAVLPLHSALTKLVYRASILEGHSLSDPDEKILFDLQIAEAEAAISLSELVLRQSRSLFRIYNAFFNLR
jgi:hypothetical protein